MAHLVLAEESPTVQKVVQLCFNEEDTEIHCFADGKSTLEYLETQPADVLLANVSMPDLDGYTLCRKVKQNPRTSHLPVILLVGVFEDFDVERSEQVGCDYHLRKPLGTLELTDLVKRLLAVSPTGPSATQSRLVREKLPPHEVGPQVGAQISKGDASSLFSLTPSQCQAAPPTYTRELSTRIDPEAVDDDRVMSSPEVLLGRLEIDLIVDRLMDRLQEELPGILRQVLQETGGRHSG